LAGAAVTFWIGVKGGEHGLERFIPEKRLERLRRKVRDSGAIALALPALMPPPFPLTPFILTCGALAVDRWRFFLTFGSMRLLRFGIEALLARRYGRGILRVLQSDTFQMVVIGFVVIAVTGTIISGVLLWRSTHAPRRAQAGVSLGRASCVRIRRTFRRFHMSVAIAEAPAPRRSLRGPAILIGLASLTALAFFAAAAAPYLLSSGYNAQQYAGRRGPLLVHIVFGTIALFSGRSSCGSGSPIGAWRCTGAWESST
jgi:hypothetical protein